MILVTGGSGRIGRYLVEALAKKENVKVLVREGKVSGAETVVGDLLNKASLEEATKNVETVYHLAAALFPTPKKVLFNVNVKGTANLLEACKKNKVSKFIYCSSIAVMGTGRQNESSPCKPTSAYGKSKLRAEMMVKNSGIPFTIVRPTDVYGPGFREGYEYVLKKIKEEKMPIIGSGKNHINFVHVRDVVNGLILAGKKPVAIGQTYIIGSDENYTQEEIMNMAADILGVKRPSKHIPVWLANLFASLEEFKAVFGKKPKIIREYVDLLAKDRIFDIRKAERELGYRPRVKLKDGIREMCEYFKYI